MNYFTQTIRLSGPVDGKDIVVLVRMACEASKTEFFCETYVHNGWESYRIGQRGPGITRRYCVLPGDGDGSELFQEHRGYRRITVVEHPEARAAYANRANNEPLIAAGRYLAEAIEKTLRPNQ